VIAMRIYQYFFASWFCLAFVVSMHGQIPTEQHDSIVNSLTMRHTGFEPTLKEFIIRRVLADESLTKFLSNRRNLSKFTLWLCDDQEAVMIFDGKGDGSVQVSLEKKMEKAEKAASNETFGHLDTIVETIANITVVYKNKKEILPLEAYEGLLFPNFCEVNLPVETVQAYLSEDEAHVYIYIYGKAIYSEDKDFYVGFRNAYIAKLIVSLNEGYIDRIIVPGRILELYNWISNPLGFIGF
jgi:hypothetical protein